MKLINKLLVCLALFAIANPAVAEDYYCVTPGGTRTSGVSTTDIQSFSWSKSACYGSVQTAVSRLTPGSQLWLDDGVYNTGSTSSIRLGASHSGTPDNYTVVRARNTGKAVVTGSAYGQVRLGGVSYAEVVGIKAIDSFLPFYVTGGSHHVKIRECAWNQRVGLTDNNSSYVLWEDCYAWGGPHRYTFQAATGANHVVYRRCLVRWDYSNVSEPIACFASYTCSDIAYQNCVAIDGRDYKGVDHGYDGLKSFFTPNGSTNVSYTGCISMNMQGTCGWWLEGPTASGSLIDCVGWANTTDEGDVTDTYKAKTFASTADHGGWTVRNCTFGLGNLGTTAIEFDSAIPESLYNCVVYGMTLNAGQYAVSNAVDYCDYNVFYANTGGRNRQAGIGSSSLTTVRPFYGGASWPVIANLGLAGKDGLGVGATIVFRTGVSGSLYGDPGWNSLTQEYLWPWPGEDRIGEDCRGFYRAPGEAYTGSPEMKGERGFCLPGRSLTWYIIVGY